MGGLWIYLTRRLLRTRPDSMNIAIHSIKTGREKSIPLLELVKFSCSLAFELTNCFEPLRIEE